MSDQLALVGTPTPPDLRLTARQRFALELVAQAGPLPSEDLGAALHEYRKREGGKGHTATTRCQFCKPEGAQMGGRLRELGVARFRRGEGWYVPGTMGSRRSSGQTAQNAADSEIPF